MNWMSIFASNEFLSIVEILVSFLLVIVAYKLFGKTGLYVWIGMSVILANIQVFKTVAIFGYVTAMGNVIYSSIFLVTDILNEVHGKKDAQKAVWLGFFILIATTLLMQLALLFTPDPSDVTGSNIHAIFSLLPRIAVASLVAYIISQLFEVWLYALIKKYHGKKYLWFRNNAAAICSQLIDNITFTLIAFWGVLPWPVVWEIFVTSYILKIVISISDTPFVYWARNMKEVDILENIKNKN